MSDPRDAALDDFFATTELVDGVEKAVQFTEQDHPRYPAGHPKAGQFMPKVGGPVAGFPHGAPHPQHGTVPYSGGASSTAANLNKHLAQALEYFHQDDPHKALVQLEGHQPYNYYGDLSEAHPVVKKFYGFRNELIGLTKDRIAAKASVKPTAPTIPAGGYAPAPLDDAVIAKPVMAAGALAAKLYTPGPAAFDDPSLIAHNNAVSDLHFAFQNWDDGKDLHDISVPAHLQDYKAYLASAHVAGEKLDHLSLTPPTFKWTPEMKAAAKKKAAELKALPPQHALTPEPPKAASTTVGAPWQKEAPLPGDFNKESWQDNQHMDAMHKIVQESGTPGDAINHLLDYEESHADSSLTSLEEHPASATYLQALKDHLMVHAMPPEEALPGTAPVADWKADPPAVPKGMPWGGTDKSQQILAALNGAATPSDALKAILSEPNFIPSGSGSKYSGHYYAVLQHLVDAGGTWPTAQETAPKPPYISDKWPGLKKKAAELHKLASQAHPEDAATYVANIPTKPGTSVHAYKEQLLNHLKGFPAPMTPSSASHASLAPPTWITEAPTPANSKAQDLHFEVGQLMTPQEAYDLAMKPNWQATVNNSAYYQVDHAALVDHLVKHGAVPQPPSMENIPNPGLAGGKADDLAVALQGLTPIEGLALLENPNYAPKGDGAYAEYHQKVKDHVAALAGVSGTASHWDNLTPAPPLDTGVTGKSLYNMVTSSSDVHDAYALLENPAYKPVSPNGPYAKYHAALAQHLLDHGAKPAVQWPSTPAAPAGPVTMGGAWKTSVPQPDANTLKYAKKKAAALHAAIAGANSPVEALAAAGKGKLLPEAPGTAYGKHHAKVVQALLAQTPNLNAPSTVAQPYMPGGTQVNKWNANTVHALTAAANTNAPITALQNVSLSTNHHPAVHQYKQALLAHFGVQTTPPTGGTPTAPTGAAAGLAGAVGAAALAHGTVIPKPPMPAAPAVDPKYDAAAQAQFLAKLEQYKQAYHAKDPIDALSNISSQSKTLGAYKQTLITALESWAAKQPQAPATAGTLVSKLQVVKDAVAQSWVSNGPGVHKAGDVHKEFSSWGNKYRASLPSAESYALSGYQGSAYLSMNEGLRQNPDKHGSDVKAMDRAMAGAHIPRAVHVIRMISSTQLAAKAPGFVGKVLADPAFMSSSLNGKFGSTRNVVLHMNVPKGSRALYLNSGAHSTEAWEYEVVLPRQTQFRVDKVEQAPGIWDKSMKTHIYATVLPPHEQDRLPVHHVAWDDGQAV